MNFYYKYCFHLSGTDNNNNVLTIKLLTYNLHNKYIYNKNLWVFLFVKGCLLSKAYSFKLVGKNMDYVRNIKDVVIFVYGDLLSFEVPAAELPDFVWLSDYLCVYTK